ncbi:uncharacterized protein BDR25DRAFT_323468 [Lindgomyces ingoldianus]|uniref:Uncharacterized protein n=1 Tax=Lindgomyces ingoldianus TaxID=673940 RepID=A0ACB6R374_9PLEO|nr:uncharacterized protein BDR25DRAFT_323468 [Lindgomyces ingoldianus]KAF2473733.1 hypothetical protein BDR25DRAFT_323468 [Lindgomyces ingoldianus]
MVRFACSQLVLERLDPVRNPGQIGSPHLHQVAGSNSFNTSIEPRYDPPSKSSCTTCTFSEDFSNYWTATLFFKAKNGTFKRKGGLAIYYISPYDGKSTVTALNRIQRGLCHRCFGANSSPFGGAPCIGDNTAQFPTKFCAGGIRTTIVFPTCWDGKNLDSPDYKSHVSYTPSGTFESNGPCLSNPPRQDPTSHLTWCGYGYGQHGDYMFGWKGDALQGAMDAQCNVNCPALKSQSAVDSEKCFKPQTVKEPISDWLLELPGGDAVTH